MTRAAERQPPGQATAPKLHVFIESRSRVPAHEGMMHANRAGVRIASNTEVDAVLNGGDRCSIHPALPCNTGTASAYVEPGKAFRQATQRIASLDNENYVVYTDPYTKERWLYRVREDFLDQKDAILLCEHPDFLFDINGKDRIIRPYVAGVVTDFPSKIGWYQPDPEYGIPHEKEISARNPTARYLQRINERVGLVARGGGYGGDYVRRGVDLYYGVSSGLGVATDAAAGEVPKVDTMEHAGDPYRGTWVQKKDGPDSKS